MYGDQLLGGGPEEDLRPVRGPLRDLVGVRHAKRRDLSQPCAIGIRHEQGSLRISVPQPLPREHDPCTVEESSTGGLGLVEGVVGQPQEAASIRGSRGVNPVEVRMLLAVALAKQSGAVRRPGAASDVHRCGVVEQREAGAIRIERGGAERRVGS